MSYRIRRRNPSEKIRLSVERIEADKARARGTGSRDDSPDSYVSGADDIPAGPNGRTGGVAYKQIIVEVPNAVWRVLEL